MQIYLNYRRYAFVFTFESLELLGYPKYLEMHISSRKDALLFVPRRSKPKNGVTFRIHKRVYDEQLSYAVGWNSPFNSVVGQMFGNCVTVAAPADLMFIKDFVPAPADDDSGYSRRKPITGLALLVNFADATADFITTELLRVYAEGCGPYDFVA